MGELILLGLDTLNQIFEAGIAITAFSLLLRALTFNLRDRVSRSFAVILLWVVVVFTGEAFGGSVSELAEQEMWLKVHWVGIVFLPAGYMQFSNALLSTTGRPSRGRRRWLVRITYVVSTGFLLMLPFDYLVGPLTVEGEGLPHLQQTTLSVLFTLYYAVMVILAGSVVWRAYRRTVLSASRRRMRYLMSGGLALSVGSYPYLLFGSDFALSNPIFFLSMAAIGNVLVFISLISMAYAVAFFGVPWPDRVVKSRLFKWLLRGPVAVFVVLLVMTFVNRAGEAFGVFDSVAIPVVTVTTLLLVEHMITLAAPVWERWLFYGGDGENLRLIQTLEERLITTADLRQFLEAVLAAACDQLQVDTAFVAALTDEGLELVVEVGKEGLLPEEGMAQALLKTTTENGKQHELFKWGAFWLLPLHGAQQDELLGLLGVLRTSEKTPGEEQREALFELGARAALVLEDRGLQRQVFRAVETLNPKVDLFQRLRAASQYDQREVLSDLEQLRGRDVSKWVREALSHYWGGPKLTQTPLMSLQIVQEAMEEHEGNTTNAMRAILRQAIERVRPEGERRFTAEWILYNILEMKFMQGRKVREVALRLAVSEADLYRKQRVAIEAVAQAVIEMERMARDDVIRQEELANHEA